MKFLNKPWVKIAGIALIVVIAYPVVIRPILQKVPGLKDYV